MANPYLKFNNKTVRVGSDGGRLISPFEPIPPYTLRVEFVDTPACQSAGFDPTQGTGVESAPDWAYGTWRHVYGNVYDWTYPSDNWFVDYQNQNGVYHGSVWGLTNGGSGGTKDDRFRTLAYRVVGANLTGVKYIPKLFYNTGKYLVSVALFDTSMIECAGGMFNSGRYSRPQYLTRLPDFDFSGIINDSLPPGCSASWAKSNLILGLMAFSNGNTKLIATPNLTFPSSRAISIEQMYSGCTALTSATLNGLHCSTAAQAFSECTNLTSATLSNCVLEVAGRMFGSPTDPSSACPLSDSLTMTNVKVVGNASYMFRYCNLKTVPLFDTSETTSMSSMFANNYNVESGALALYQQASSQATPPSTYGNCFTNCGRDTVTGSAELAQIPTDWGGTMSA